MSNLEEQQELQKALSLQQGGRLDQAADLYRRIVRKNPKNYYALHYLGIIEAIFGNYEEAKALMDRSLSIQPPRAEFAENYATILFQMADYKSALEVARRGLQLGHANVPLLYVGAIALFRLERLEESVAQFDKLLLLAPNHIAAINERGSVLAEMKKYDDALVSFEKALTFQPQYAEAHLNKGNVLGALKRYDDALAAYDKALALKPGLAAAWAGRGNVLRELKRYDEALGVHDKALTLKPDLADAWLGRGNVFFDLKRYDDAFAAYDRALTLKPDLAKAWFGRGNVLVELKRYDEAFTAYDRVLTLKPDLAEAWLSRGNVFFDLKRYDEAFAAYDRALTLEPDLAAAWLGRGNVFSDLKRYDDAFAAYDRALTIKTDLAGAWLGRGSVFFDLKRYDEAFAAYDKALALKPDFAEAWTGRGNVFNALKRYDEAFTAYDKALALKPDLAGAWLGRGSLFFELNRFDDAVAAYDRALAAKPDLAEAWLGRGEVLNVLKRYDEAFTAYDKALALKPEFNSAASSRLNSKLHMCDWRGLNAELAQFLAMINERRPSPVRPAGSKTDDGVTAVGWSPSPVMTMARLTDNSAILLRSAIEFVRANACYPAPFAQVGSPRTGKPRLGYISQDFRAHVTGMGVVEMFEQHDRSKFELFGFSLAPDDGSVTRKRIAGAFDHFHDFSAVGDEAAARRIYDLDIDVLVELVPHSRGSRPAILAYRPAPVQVNGWSAGYSAGAPFIDYILGDQWMLPFEDQPFFLEKIVHLPHACFPHNSTQAIAPRTPSRSDEGLPEQGLVFCCFNAGYKIRPEFFAAWMRLLREVAGSVLWLARNNDIATANLRREASEAGIDPARLVFAERRPALADHLARHRLADLFLDTLPYNAQSTAMDALWAGLPVLTCAGRSYAGRIATSQLVNIGLPELVAEDLAAYERLAVALARDPQRLQQLKAKLETNRLTTPLFDTKRLCRELEAAYATMVDIWRRGESPRSFTVEPARSQA